MPKYTVTWKDPDQYCKESRGFLICSDEELDKLYNLGFSEYITIEFDADTMTTKAINSKGG